MIDIGKHVVARKTTQGKGRTEIGEVTTYDETMTSVITDTDAAGNQTTEERETPYEVTWGFLEDGSPDTSWHAEDELEVVV